MNYDCFKQLNLDTNALLGDESCIYLSNIIKNSKSLESIGIMTSSISDIGAKLIADSLKDTCSLR
jgi:hypothetical protein